jgi:hypothetical protein
VIISIRLAVGDRAGNPCNAEKQCQYNKNGKIDFLHKILLYIEYCKLISEKVRSSICGGLLSLELKTA